MNKPPSLIKWSGSKRSQAEAIAALFPANRRGSYFEPFLGGGSVLYFGASRFGRCEASDLYRPLIDIWDSVKNRPEVLKREYEDDWNALQENFPEYFYEVRDRFNAGKNGRDLLFLSRTCVNGIIRFNKQGEFNNALHLSRRGMKPRLFNSIVDKWAAVLGNTTFRVCDYASILERLQPNDFVYMDPPYVNSHNRYVEDLAVDRFLEFLARLNDARVKWALSFDGTRGDDDFTYAIPRDLYVRRIMIDTGFSHVQKVLNGTSERVAESLYLNYVPPASAL